MMSICETNELAEKNIKLVYYIYGKLCPTFMVTSNKDDLISEGMLGLIKAARSYKEDKSTFATYASACIRNNMLMYMRKLKKFADKEVSLFSICRLSPKGEELLIEDIIEDKRDYIKESSDNIALMDFIGKQTERDKKILRLYYKGRTMTEIGKELNLSQSYISRIINKIKAVYRLKKGEIYNGNKENKYN